MKKIYLQFFLLTLIVGYNSFIFGQADSITMSNFNYVKSIFFHQDSIAKTFGDANEEVSQFSRWAKFWKPRIGTTGDYDPMVQATNDYVQVFTVTSIKKFQHD